ncbi:hypothetical protein KEM52_004337, partial [Ascosphaera acerosa]
MDLAKVPTLGVGGHKGELRQGSFQRSRRQAPSKATNIVRGTFIDVQDLQTFLSLPAKVQKQLFTPDERAFFQWWSSNIFEAAQTYEPYREPQSPLAREFDDIVMDREASPQHMGLKHADSAIAVDAQLISCLDAHDIDLTLSDYSGRVRDVYAREACPTSPGKHSRGTSLGHDWTFNPGPQSAVEHHHATSCRAYGVTAPPTPDPAFDALDASPMVPRLSSSSSSASCRVTRAAHWQDPEARWKLKEYLSNPENFDEAVQLGFPSRANSNATRPFEPHMPAYIPPTPPQDEPRTPCTVATAHSTTPLVRHARSRTLSKSRDSVQSSLTRFDPQPARPASSNSKPISDKLRGLTSKKSMKFRSESRQSEAEDQGVDGRQMTIKMTLTPPDLLCEHRWPAEPSSPPAPPSPTALPPIPPSLADKPLPTAPVSDTLASSPGGALGGGEGDDCRFRRMWKRLRKHRTSTPNGTAASAAAAASHKLGPKANTGAINAGLRALDRTGTPCRKWSKRSFRLKSFTGVTWEVPAWSAPARPKTAEELEEERRLAAEREKEREERERERAESRKSRGGDKAGDASGTGLKVRIRSRIRAKRDRRKTATLNAAAAAKDKAGEKGKQHQDAQRGGEEEKEVQDEDQKSEGTAVNGNGDVADDDEASRPGTAASASASVSNSASALSVADEGTPVPDLGTADPSVEGTPTPSTHNMGYDGAMDEITPSRRQAQSHGATPQTNGTGNG